MFSLYSKPMSPISLQKIILVSIAVVCILFVYYDFTLIPKTIIRVVMYGIHLAHPITHFIFGFLRPYYDVFLEPYSTPFFNFLNIFFKQFDFTHQVLE